MKEHISDKQPESASRLPKAKLRKRAERVHSSSPPASPDLISLEKDRLMHELEVHQVELEIQNEELLRVQQELEKSRQRYIDLFDFAPVGYFVLDRHMLIVQANLTGGLMLGVERGRLVRKRFSRFILPAFGDIFHFCMKKVIEGGERSCEVQLRKEGGLPFWAELSIVIVPDSDNYRVTVTDIGRRKRAEESARRLNEVLAQRAADLEIANKELKDMDFILSQDLKGTSRQVEGFSQAVLEDYAGKLDEQGVDYLQRIQRASHKMTGYFDNLIKLAGITSAKLQMEQVDLSAVVENISLKLRADHPERRVEIIIEAGLTAAGDFLLLRMAMQNLLDNAFKFTSSCPIARIEFGRSESKGETTYFIRDNGIGFDMKYSSRLFIPFQRLHSRKEFPGNGIGLAIVQRVIRRHGGIIYAEARPDEGAAFYFTLPIPPKGDSFPLPA